MTRAFVLGLAIESFFAVYRARVRNAVGTDPRQLEALLSLLPRAPERRKRAVAEPERTPAPPPAPSLDRVTATEPRASNCE